MIAEKYEDMKVSAEECLSDVGEYFHRGTDQITHMIDAQPARSLLVSCLAGFAVGLAISRVFMSEKSSSTSFDSGTAERFGRNLLDKIEHLVPTMLRERLSR